MKHHALLLGLLVMLWVSGCGQKGGLYKSANVPPPAMEDPQDKKPAE